MLVKLFSVIAETFLNCEPRALSAMLSESRFQPSDSTVSECQSSYDFFSVASEISNLSRKEFTLLAGSGKLAVTITQYYTALHVVTCHI